MWLCNQRALCPICDQIKANKAATKALWVLQTVDLPAHYVRQHLTLTTRFSGDLVADRELLSAGTVRLWQGPLLQGRKASKLCLGLVVSIENGPSNGMVHAHCLWVGPELTKGHLRKEWKRITAGLGSEAHQVEITTRDDAPELVAEVCKYPLKHSAVSPPQLVTLWKARRHSHQTRWFGIFHGKALQKVTGLEKDELDEQFKRFRQRQGKCKVCGTEAPPTYVQDYRAAAQYLVHVAHAARQARLTAHRSAMGRAHGTVRGPP